jgi:hypothetical protein
MARFYVLCIRTLSTTLYVYSVHTIVQVLNFQMCDARRLDFQSRHLIIQNKLSDRFWTYTHAIIWCTPGVSCVMA